MYEAPAREGRILVAVVVQTHRTVWAYVNPILCRPTLLDVPPQAHKRMTLRIIRPAGLLRGLLAFQWTREISVPHKPPIFGLIFEINGPKILGPACSF
jgi:hypothetical protein